LRKHLRRKYEQEIILSRYQPPGPFPLVLVLDHLKAGFNVPKIIRTANAFGVREIHFIGIGAFDPGPAKGTLRHTKSLTFQTFAESHRELAGQGYSFYALEPRGTEVLGQVSFPEKTALIMGHEEYGLSFRPEEFPDVKLLRIPQFGLVDSLNVSIAASLACFEFIRQRNFEIPEGYVRLPSGREAELPRSPGTLV
jgi:tRNA G18 (ribose-2'-O)-methylase SpoU